MVWLTGEYSKPSSSKSSIIGWEKACRKLCWMRPSCLRAKSSSTSATPYSRCLSRMKNYKSNDSSIEIPNFQNKRPNSAFRPNIPFPKKWRKATSWSTIPRSRTTWKDKSYKRPFLPSDSFSLAERKNMNSVEKLKKLKFQIKIN